MKQINQKFLTGERALFQGKDLEIYDTTFADGESPLKESRNIELYRSMFKWKYPLWYSHNIKMEDCVLFEMGRAGIWYTENISMKNCIVEAPKNFRRTTGIELERVTMPNAGETLWNCDQIRMDQVSAEIHHARLLSKDAFWNSENVTVYDSFISGEYLGWNAKNLTLINCTIESSQGMCYIDNLVMKNCRLLNTTLAFEYSTVDVEVNNTIDSVLNPNSGIIRAGKIEELIMDASKIDVTKTFIQTEELKEAV